MEVGTGQKDMVLCYLGSLHNYYNSHYTSDPVLVEAHSLDGFLQRTVGEVALQESSVEPLEDLEAQEEEHFLQMAPVLEQDTGNWGVVFHSL